MKMQTVDPVMRAKLLITSVDKHSTFMSIKAMPVSGNKPYGPNGESEDNTFARYTPGGNLELSITNPALFDKLEKGQKFYVDFFLTDD
jgi:hypothetical protein